jgi:hypothetical protein
MRSGIRSRPLIALAAAYAVALQALLLPLSVAAAAPFAASPCAASAAAEGAGAPVSHPNGCPCAAGCGMACADHHALPPPSPAVAAIGETYAGTAPLAPVLDPVARPALRLPQVPRAPPSA